MTTKTEYERIGAQIVDAAFHVHCELGPGLLESVYKVCMIEELKPINEVQLVTYLKLTNLHLGYLINFNVPLIKNGIKRKINGYIN